MGIRMNDKLRSIKKYDYREPLNKEFYKSDKEINDFLHKIINTSAFKRLNDISFLGGIDLFYRKEQKHLFNHKKCTRFQHSLGVARLAMFYAYRKELDIKNRKLIAAAALLHDIGHAPLSHTLENFFERTFNINHHEAGVKIILGESPYEQEITNLLKFEQIDPYEVVEVISGKNNYFDNFFSGPINFDTIEGILRSHLYIKRKENDLHPEKVVLAAINRQKEGSEKIVDNFWECKMKAYNKIIKSERGIISDYICELFLSDKLEKNDYFSTDNELLKKSPRFKSFIFDERKSPSLPHKDIMYISRSFSINKEVAFSVHNDKLRYVQSKERKTLSLDSSKYHSIF